MPTERSATLVVFLGGVLSVWMPQQAMATTMTAQELPLTHNGAFNTTPVGAHDSISPWVVYAQSASQSTVWYQRFDANALLGTAVEVSTGSTSDELDDTDGNHIVYTAYISASTLAGSVNLYDPATGSLVTVANANSIFGARVSGDNVVWLQGTSGTVSLMLASISMASPTPMVVAGPTPTVSSADVGSRFVVYEEVVNGQRDVMAYDLQQHITVPVANDPNVNERLPHTSGPWVVWEVQATGSSAVMALNMDTNQMLTVAQSTGTVASPTIDGNLIAYQGNPNGITNIYVYRIPTGDTFQVTANANNEQLSDVFGSQVTYVDNRTGTYNVYVSTLTFSDTVVSDPNTTTTGTGGVINPNATDPNSSDPNASNPNATDPNSGYQGGCGHHWCDRHGHEPYMSAWRRHGQTQVDVGFCRPIPLEVPYSLPANDRVQSESRTVYLMFQDQNEQLTVCTYEHKAGSDGDRPYALVSCTNGVQAGQGVRVKYVDLNWHMAPTDRDEPGSVVSIDLRDFTGR